MIHQAPKINSFPGSASQENHAVRLEKRKCARVPVCVPVSCTSFDSRQPSPSQNKAIVKDVSQTGLRIETGSDLRSDKLKLAFVDANKAVVEIMGKVVFSQKTPAGIYKVGVQLQGSQPDVIQFVARLVRFYHYTKRSIN